MIAEGNRKARDLPVTIDKLTMDSKAKMDLCQGYFTKQPKLTLWFFIKIKNTLSGAN